MAQTSCPDGEVLRALLDDRLPPHESAALTGHIDTCAGCQRALDGLTAPGPWPGAARLAAERPPPETALQRAIQELHAQACVTEAPFAGPPPGDVALDFLRPSPDPAHLGRLGPYDVLEVVGRGGMGVVLKAFDPALHRLVAIKVLSPHLTTSAAARKRFLREAQAAAAINHDHVVTIHAVEEADGLPYQVMQYVSGRSLQQRLDSAGPPDLPELLRLARQISAGLAAAHAHGVVHRDIKPGNILLEAAPGPPPCLPGPRRQTERVKITDFGLARTLDDTAISQPGVVAGTPLYMSPEQIAGNPVDHRSDLYSLGVLLYRLAAGREPFTGDTVAAVWSQHLFERPPPLAGAGTPVPAWLEELVLRLLQKDPAARPQTAEDVLRQLDRHAAAPPLPPDEAERLAALRRYRILDTDPEQGFDDLTLLAAHVCGTPIALITLLDADRQWFKSKLGLSLRETSRNVSFCAHTILQGEPFIVRDAAQDERFAEGPLVRCDPHVRFYAGIPLISPDGHALGALCVMDRVPRHLSPDQVSALTALGRLVLTQLELRRNLLDLKDALAQREGPAPPPSP